MKDKSLTLSDQDLDDRVSEVTNRFCNFIFIVAPIGQTLLSTLTYHNAPIALVESFVGPMCKVVVDDVIAGLTVQRSRWGMEQYFTFTRVPLLCKVAAKSVAEVAAHSILDVLKPGNKEVINTGTLAGIVNMVAKNSA